MNEYSNHNQLIDRYIEEIGYHLPRKLRSDIQAEIRSSILDMVDDRAQGQGGNENMEIIIQILQEYGHPDEVAKAYSAPRYLIGPGLYPSFTLVLKILSYLLIASLFLSLILTQGFVITFTAGTGEAILNLLLGFITSTFSMFGSLVILFAILERVLPQPRSKPKPPVKEWQPQDLLKQKHSERVRISKQVSDIIVSLGVITWLNFFPQWIGAFYSNANGWGFVPMLSPAFKDFIPWITLRLGIGIIFSFVLLKIGTWDWKTRWISIALNLLSIFILLSIISGTPIVGLSPEFLEMTGSQIPNQDLYQTLLPGMSYGVNLALGCVILGISLSTLKKFLEVVRRGEVITIPLKR